MKLHNLFPTLVMEFDLSDEMPVKNLKELIDNNESVQAYRHGKIEHGFSSHGCLNHILDESDFAPLKELFQTCVDQYSNNVGMGDLNIIQSWFNVYLQGGKIGAHRHEGSVCSAAFYPYCEDGSASLQFHSPLKPYRMNEIFEQETEYNTYFWKFPAKQNTLYLFPSWLEHETEINLTNERYVISFNTQRANEV